MNTDNLKEPITWFRLDAWVRKLFKKNTELETRVEVLENSSGGGDSRPYKVYTALLTQLNTDTPVATVLENTLGEDVIWSYENVGIYKGSLPNGFDLNKTYYSAGGNIHYFSSFEIGITLDFDNKIRITNKKNGDFSDNDLYYYPVEIRVYN